VNYQDSCSRLQRQQEPEPPTPGRDGAGCRKGCGQRGGG
jgi:hypothetical protein